MSHHESSRLTRADLLLRATVGVVGLVGLGRTLPGSSAAAAGSRGPSPSMVIHDEPIERGRRLAGRRTARFNLLGLHWRGSGDVWFRCGDGLAWTPWQRAVVHELADGEEGETRGWRLGTPVWTGGSTELEYRLGGDVRALRAHEIWSPVDEVARRPALAPAPFVVPRASWGADETIVRAEPGYADRLRFAVVHHTAGKSPLTPEESAAIVRGIQAYHVEGNGWNDIGYNFLVDAFGQVFEGRRGGIDRNVIGAHALGFNTGSVGVAVLGNFERELPTPEAQAALAQLLSWRLDVGHVDPLALVSAASTAGEVRTLRAVSGHRDVGNTACPGENLYPLLDGLAQQAAAIGLPKLYDPLPELAERAVRFTARLSASLPWSVSVAGPDGSEVARGGGEGAAVDWTWDATAVPDGRYAWAIAATPDVLAAGGTVVLGSPATSPGQVERPPKPARPGGLPRRIPGWAWRLRAWHRTPRPRGPRPAGSPRRLPSWYWSWFHWVNAVERWQRQS